MEPKKADLPVEKAEPKSYTNSTAPSVTVIFKTKRRMMWPLYLLGLVEYRPRNFDDPDVKQADLESLRMALGEELAIIYGYDLVQIQIGLSEGQGCVLTEQGERFVALGKRGEPRIAKIEVKAAREEAPAHEADSQREVGAGELVH